MNVVLLKEGIGLMVTSVLLVWSLAVFIRAKTVGSSLQLLGTISLLVVVLTHMAEALHVFSFMRWGEPNSVGHRVDLLSAILGITCFPMGVVVRAFANRARHPNA